MKALGLIIKVLALLALTPQAEADIGTVDFTKLSVFGSGCKIDGEEEDNRPAATIMYEANKYYDTKKFCKAAQGYAQVRRQAPPGNLFSQAQYKLVLSLYADGQATNQSRRPKSISTGTPNFPKPKK